MRVSLNWLKSYVNISDLSPEDIAHRLTMAGLEVEGIERKNPIEAISAAIIEEVQEHPNAKKLHLCKVFDGKGRHNVVCGAPNARAGLITVLAHIGAEIGGVKIKEGVLRGVKSEGMLCSEKELGLSEDHAGIIELPPDTPLDANLNELLGIEDIILDIAITPNRGDCLCIYGIAREVSALFERELHFNPFVVSEEDMGEISAYTAATKDVESCPYYTARIIKGVKLAPSPLWMQNRIKSAGMRPLNNVVDITNYVMLEYGQPLHAFDLKVIDRGIVVRRAAEAEKFTTLDGKVRDLDASVAVIADHSKTLAIAGVMGGEYSGINDATTDIFLECACFNPASISLTSRKLGMNTDSAYRYIRGMDFGRSRSILDYAASLFSDICGGTVLAGALTAGEQPPESRTFNFSISKVNSLIGLELSADHILTLLGRLNIKGFLKEDATAAVIVPSYRNDIKHVADIAEEIARLYGIERIPSRLPSFSPKSAKEKLNREGELRELLINSGFNECINYSFLPDSYLADFCDTRELVYLINPLSNDMNALRTYIFPSLIKTLEHNWNQGERSIRLFEIGSVFQKTDRSRLEPLHLAFGFIGGFIPLNWAPGGAYDNFYYLKGVCSNIFAKLRLTPSYIPSKLGCLHPGKSADIFIGKDRAGFIGALHPNIAAALDLKAEVYFTELDLSFLFSLGVEHPPYKRFSRFPSVYKDISLVVDIALPAENLRGLISGISPLVQAVVLFDIYSGEGLASNREKSLTFRIFFSSPDKTLTDEEINPLLYEAESRAAAEFNARLR
ncbi:MAG: phenylalanine--tRNA ligase subunit beta [Deferribacteraceae bacterium]|jgi:phenylalanyl-tRNA synthetase beta chain|nr:phenylalanine--tRNA ligase subunit beta [Deferribacteraceae bacterium]